MSDFHYILPINSLLCWHRSLISNIVKWMNYARPFYIGRVIHRVHYTYSHLEKILVGDSRFAIWGLYSPQVYQIKLDIHSSIYLIYSHLEKINAFLIFSDIRNSLYTVTTTFVTYFYELHHLIQLFSFCRGRLVSAGDLDIQVNFADGASSL